MVLIAVLVHDVQKHNPKKIIDKYGKEALVKFADYNIEKIAQACRDKNVQQIFIIIDAKKFTFKQLTAPGGKLSCLSYWIMILKGKCKQNDNVLIN